MQIAPVIDKETFESLAEDLRESYAERDDGSYRLAALEDWTSPAEIDGLKSALRKERENARGHFKAKAELETSLQEQITNLQTQVDTMQHERDAAQIALQRATADRQKFEAVIAAKGNPELVMPLLEKRTKVTNDGEVRVLDDQGRVRVTDEGQPMSLPALLEEMRADASKFGGAFYSHGGSGGGTHAASGSGTARVSSNLRRSRMTPKEKVGYIRAHGEDAFLRIPY
jgi:hypothetical protein